jgi:hypothetical protein
VIEEKYLVISSAVGLWRRIFDLAETVWASDEFEDGINVAARGFEEYRS